MFNQILPIGALCSIIAGTAIGFTASGLIADARVRQATYLCEAGYEVACYRMAELTNGQCAAPGGLVYGCRYDSRVLVINDQRAVRDHNLITARQICRLDGKEPEHCWRRVPPPRFLKVKP